jgi:hypothetical protein
MDGGEFRLALERLGFTQSSFAREFGIPLRTVQHWGRLGASRPVTHLLQALLQHAVAPPDATIDLGSALARHDAARACSNAVAAVLEQGARAGWPHGILLAGLIERLLDEVAQRR